MIKHLLCMCVAVFLFTGCGEAQENKQFFETLYDVPIMEGLEEVPDMGLSFDKVGGRIAEAGAQTSILSDREILSFYKTALEQMGWSQAEGQYDPYIFTREGEKLSIFLTKSDSSTQIRFLLGPYEA